LKDLSYDTIAFVYLTKANDEKNRCLLTNQSLIIISKGKTHIIGLEKIRSAQFSDKIFLLPIVLGGAFGPFFFIALFNHSIHPAISLSGFLISVLAFYLGIAGKRTFRIETENDVREIFLHSISPNLKEFVSFLNDIISGNEKETVLTFYLPLDNDRFKELKNTGILELNQSGEECLTTKEFQKKKQESYDGEMHFLSINYKLPTIQIKFERDQTGKLRPRAFGTLSIENDLINSQL